MGLKKPIIIFTNFREAESILKNSAFIVNNKVIQFSKDEVEAFSISLESPPFLKNKFKDLSFFQTSWEIMSKYSSNRDWGEYESSYRERLLENKEEINNWLTQLENKIYILASCEDTSKGANSLRKILYEAFKKSKKAKNIANFLYRDGNCETFKKEKQTVA
jgi:hypothetical protein